MRDRRWTREERGLKVEVESLYDIGPLNQGSTIEIGPD
jgi:hypothetical protein